MKRVDQYQANKESSRSHGEAPLIRWETRFSWSPAFRRFIDEQSSRGTALKAGLQLNPRTSTAGPTKILINLSFSLDFQLYSDED